MGVAQTIETVEKLLKHAGLGIDAGFHCGEVWSTEVLF
jgi:hypothetical protein